MKTSEKVRENRLRRMAKRQGLYLEKSRRRDPKAIDYGGYMLIDEKSNTVVLGSDGFPYQATMDDVEDFLTGERKYDDLNLLERAKNHKTNTEGREILIETFKALKSGNISVKESEEISRIIGKATKKAMKEIKSGKKSKYLQDK